MSNNKVNKRVQKTHRLLKDALVELILEKGYEAVTINEILDRAKVGRSTFYIHFDNKHELLHGCFEEFLQLFEKQVPKVVSDKSCYKEIENNGFILNLFRLVEQRSRLFQAFLGKDGMPMINHPIYHYVHTYFDEVIHKAVMNNKQTLIKQNPIKQEMLSHYLTSAFVGTLTWWISRGMPYTVEEMDQYFKQLIRNDIRNLAGADLAQLF